MLNHRKKSRHEISQLEKALADSRKELELLRVEYEHNMKAHEQIGPMAKEMRHLINSLQVRFSILLFDCLRYRTTLRFDFLHSCMYVCTYSSFLYDKRRY